VISRIVYGMVGDWWADRIPSKSKFSYRFQIDQDICGSSYGEYLNHLAKWFYAEGYCSSPNPKTIFRKVSKSSRIDAKTRTIHRLTLFTHTSFDWIYNDFYTMNGEKRIKTIPNWIGDYLTPLS